MVIFLGTDFYLTIILLIWNQCVQLRKIVTCVFLESLNIIFFTGCCLAKNVPKIDKNMQFVKSVLPGFVAE